MTPRRRKTDSPGTWIAPNAREIVAATFNQPTDPEEDLVVSSPTEATITLSLSEYQASALIGALLEFGERWEEERENARAVAGYVRGQCPAEWIADDGLEELSA